MNVQVRRADGTLVEMTADEIAALGSVSLVDGLLTELTKDQIAALPPAPNWKDPLPDVALFQCRILLSQLPSRTGDVGKTLLDDVDAAIRARGGAALIAWEYSNTVTRTGPLLLAMAAELNLSDAELDAMFAQAAQIVV